MEMKTNTEEFLHMNAGTGGSSYAQNSTRQKSGLERAQPVLEESILSMKLMDCKTFCIAELGCSSGPNALLPAENIIKTLEAKYLSAGNFTVPQFQVFLSDLPSTDFNTLFRSLSPSVATEQIDAAGVVTARSYFAAGVPGSFYGRLFPDKSLHFVHSSFGLHWLSQVPCEVLEKNSVTWNKGKISAGGSPAVGEAYFRQFQRDFNTFLRARAKEMVGGGRMCLLLIGRTSRDPTDQGFIALNWGSLENSLNDLVSQGLIEQEKVDSFNLPLFCPCVEEIRSEMGMEEIRSEIVREDSFEIQRLELVKKTDSTSKEDAEAMSGSVSAKEAYGLKAAKQKRATMESMLKYHFGDEVMEALFQRYAETMANRVSELMKYAATGGLLIIVLERK